MSTAVIGMGMGSIFSRMRVGSSNSTESPTLDPSPSLGKGSASYGTLPNGEVLLSKIDPENIDLCQKIKVSWQISH